MKTDVNNVNVLNSLDSSKLKFLVLKDIWLAATGPMGEKSKIIGWISEKPPYDNGHIEKGTTWIFDHLYENVLVFGRIENGEIVSDWADFSQEDLEMLARDGVIELIDKDSSSSSPSSSPLISWPIKDFGEFSKYADSIAEKYIDQSVLSSCDYIITQRDTIEFPFAVDYKNEWGIWEGIREIIQNSMDTETRLDIYTPDPNTLVIHDEGKGLSIKDFRLGGGEKAKLEESKKYIPNCDPEKLIRGAHGEGMKLTFLVLSKEPEKYKFYHYSRCIKATAEFVMSQRFKEQTLDIHLDPIKPHRGTTFILNTYSNIISKLLTYCKTRFVYHNLYINGERSTHTEYDMLTKYISDADNKTVTKLIGHIVDMHAYNPIRDVDKPLYIRGIYVRDIRTVFSYDFICPYLDSARNIVDISQIKDQIKRIYTHLEFKGINASTVAETFVRTINDGKDIDFIENNISFYSHDIRTGARDVYRKVWDDVFGKNAFIPSDPTLTQLAMEQLYVERDTTGNIIREVHYKQVKTPYILERIFLASDVPKDSDIVVQQTIDVPYSMEKIKKEEPHLIKNLREAISVLCPIYKLNIDEEIEKWDAFLIEYKTENQPPRNLWKNWDNIGTDTRENIFHEIYDLYREFSSYPIIIEKGLNLPISDRSKTILGEIISENIYKMKKSEIISKYAEIAKEIEKYENRIIPVKHKLGYYNHTRERFGIRYDCLAERDKTFTVVIHEYAHKMKEVDDIDDYDSAMGKILSVIQNGYGIILNESFLYADEIYEHYILKTIIDRISSTDMQDSTREEILDSLKELPDSISEVVFEMCRDKKYPTRTYVEELAELERQETEESIGTKTRSEDERKEEEEERLRREREIWEKTAVLHGEEYVRTEGFTRTENNLDYMLKNYSWDAVNKTLEENIAFDARDTSFGDVHVVKMERLTEPLATNYDKENLPGNYPGTFYDNVAYLSNGNIFAYNLRKDGKYPNIPWSVAIFEKAPTGLAALFG